MEGCLVPKHLQAGAARPGPSEGEAGRDMTDGAEPLAAAPAAAPAGDDAAGSASEPQSPCLQSPPRVRRSGTPSGLSDDTSWGRVGGSDADAPLSSDAEPDAAGAAPAATPSPAASAALTGAAAAEEAAAGPVASEEDTDGTAAAAGTAGGLRRRRGAEAASGGAGRGATAAAADEAAPGAGPAASRAPAARRARLLRRAAALQATFLFSGLWHMMIWQHHHVGGAGWRWLVSADLSSVVEPCRLSPSYIRIEAEALSRAKKLSNSPNRWNLLNLDPAGASTRPSSPCRPPSLWLRPRCRRCGCAAGSCRPCRAPPAYS